MMRHRTGLTGVILSTYKGLHIVSSMNNFKSVITISTILVIITWNVRLRNVRLTSSGWLYHRYRVAGVSQLLFDSTTLAKTRYVSLSTTGPACLCGSPLLPLLRVHVLSRASLLAVHMCSSEWCSLSFSAFKVSVSESSPPREVFARDVTTSTAAALHSCIRALSWSHDKMQLIT